LREFDSAGLQRNLAAQIGRQKFGLHGVTRERLWQLHIEDKIVRRLAAPALNRPGGGKRVERGVHFHVIEVVGIPAQQLRFRQLGRIPVFNEAGVRPTRGADAELRRHAKTIALAR